MYRKNQKKKILRKQDILYQHSAYFNKIFSKMRGNKSPLDEFTELKLFKINKPALRS